MAARMILRLSLDTHIYAIDRDHVLVVRGWTFQCYLDAEYSFDTLYDPDFWFPRVGQEGVYIQQPPYPPEFGLPVDR